MQFILCNHCPTIYAQNSTQRAQRPNTGLQDSLSNDQIDHAFHSLPPRVGTSHVKSPSEYSALRGTGLYNIFIGIYQNITKSWQKAHWTFRIWHHLMYDFFSSFPREQHPPILWKCTHTSQKKKWRFGWMTEELEVTAQFTGQQPLTLGREGRAVLKGRTMMRLFDLELW